VPVVPRGIGGGALAEPPAHPTIVDGLGPSAVGEKSMTAADVAANLRAMDEVLRLCSSHGC
jgi:hypothetical protein